MDSKSSRESLTTLTEIRNMSPPKRRVGRPPKKDKKLKRTGKCISLTQKSWSLDFCMPTYLKHKFTSKNIGILLPKGACNLRESIKYGKKYNAFGFMFH